MAPQSKKKKFAIAGGALLLVAGVTVGGALVTANSTIFNNQFSAEVTEKPADGELLVTGAPMSNTFTGAMDGEVITGYYTAKNTSNASTLTVGIGSQVQPGGVKAGELAAALDTRIAINDGALKPTGALNDMKFTAGETFDLAPGESAKVRVDVYVADADAFRGLDLDGAEVTADYLFNSIAK
ncbi:hypothetical protein [Leucobacter chromiireducens]|uniref:Alternate-type signal peptide domain-containing protein n=1 Tax=Leucobacter chromiireducens subsp. chromiireducens TaxID=660067 RepID=A0ABS1SNP3_9MICO|nr:hypothetical protein [Leucobacter chromiireducens]MBL3689802.1 hypothetical protein [Leucobacter chromiireducens subsp. chromiireducens]